MSDETGVVAVDPLSAYLVGALQTPARRSGQLVHTRRHALRSLHRTASVRVRVSRGHSEHVQRIAARDVHWCRVHWRRVALRLKGGLSSRRRALS